MKPLILNYPIDRQYDLNAALNKLLPAHFFGRLGGGSEQGGRRTDFNLHKQGIKEVDELVTWINSVLPDVGAYYARLRSGEKCGFNANGFKITNMWGIRYDKGDCVRPHNHFPFTLSLGYYICTPKGCSPLKVKNTKIKIHAGQCIFFPGSNWHSVAPEPVGGRCLIAANVLYTGGAHAN